MQPALRDRTSACPSTWGPPSRSCQVMWPWTKGRVWPCPATLRGRLLRSSPGLSTTVLTQVRASFTQWSITVPMWQKAHQDGSFCSIIEPCCALIDWTRCDCRWGRQELRDYWQCDHEWRWDLRVHSREQCGLHPSALICPHQRWASCQGLVRAIHLTFYECQLDDLVNMCCVSPEPPVLKGEAHMSQTVILGASAVLDCPIHGDPSPVLRWLREGKPLLRSIRMQALHNGSLVIYSISVNTELLFLHCRAATLSRQVILNHVWMIKPS